MTKRHAKTYRGGWNENREIVGIVGGEEKSRS